MHLTRSGARPLVNHQSLPTLLTTFFCSNETKERHDTILSGEFRMHILFLLQSLHVTEIAEEKS